MYHSRKMGVFISHIYGDYQRNVCQGIIDKAIEYGYIVEIFTTSDGENLGSYSLGEQSIIQIPNFAELDGVIFASGTYVSEELREAVRAKLHAECQAPVIEICDKALIYPALSLDNNSAFRELAAHFVLEHHAKRICFLGCAPEAVYSDLRKEYISDTLHTLNVSFDDTDCYDCEYTDASVAEALQFFLQKGKPDAILCYNDNLALRLLPDLLRLGYSVPEDIAISGCDQLEEGRNITHVLTTISFPVYELGITAVDLLMKRLQKKEIPSMTTVHCEPVYEQSCGCGRSEHKSVIFYQQKLTHRINRLETDLLESMRISACLQGITDIDEGMDILAESIGALHFCSEFYLCLNTGWDSLSDHILALTNQEPEALDNTTDLTLKLAIRHGKRLPECSFAKKSILPEFLYQDTASAYIVTPLFFENQDYGYVAMAYEENKLDYHFQLILWMMNISQMLKNINDSQKTTVLVNRLEEMYLKDPLTGLYNHQGFDHYSQLMLEKCSTTSRDICCFLFDMDELKTVNDRFGHKEGDFALQVIAHALENAAFPDMICARLSGDEFYLLSASCSSEEADDFLAGIEKYLTNYNALSSKPYNVSISGGYSFYSLDSRTGIPDTGELFAQADAQMYLIKQKKRKHIIKEG